VNFSEIPLNGLDLLTYGLMTSLPTIEHLMLVCDSIQASLHYLSTTLLWSFLTKLTLGRNFSEESMQFLVSMLRHRMSIGCSIATLCLPKPYQTRNMLDYSVLKDIVEIECFDWETYVEELGASTFSGLD
jgi:hypothetical protein